VPGGQATRGDRRLGEAATVALERHRGDPARVARRRPQPPARLAKAVPRSPLFSEGVYVGRVAHGGRGLMSSCGRGAAGAATDRPLALGRTREPRRADPRAGPHKLSPQRPPPQCSIERGRRRAASTAPAAIGAKVSAPAATDPPESTRNAPDRKRFAVRFSAPARGANPRCGVECDGSGIVRCTRFTRERSQARNPPRPCDTRRTAEASWGHSWVKTTARDVTHSPASSGNRCAYSRIASSALSSPQPAT
jgi:hypothetical protein